MNSLASIDARGWHFIRGERHRNSEGIKEKVLSDPAPRETFETVPRARNASLELEAKEALVTAPDLGAWFEKYRGGVQCEERFMVEPYRRRCDLVDSLQANGFGNATRHWAVHMCETLGHDSPGSPALKTLFR